MRTFLIKWRRVGRSRLPVTTEEKIRERWTRSRENLIRLMSVLGLGRRGARNTTEVLGGVQGARPTRDARLDEVQMTLKPAAGTVRAVMRLTVSNPTATSTEYATTIPASNNLPKVTREPYLHFLVDASRGSVLSDPRRLRAAIREVGEQFPGATNVG